MLARDLRKIRSLAAWDKRYVWHPFTQQAEWAGREPIIIESGKGVWLRDIQGRRLLDGNSSLWVNVFGHREPALDRALRRQLGKMAHSTFLGLTHEPAIRLAKALIDIAPDGLSRVFYSDNGSTSVEVALKMAYQYWQLRKQSASSPQQSATKQKLKADGWLLNASKNRFLSLKHGYHGDTLGSVSVGGVQLFHQRFHDLLFTGYQVTPGDFKEIEAVLKKHHQEIAAVVMEPLIQGASGMLIMPKGYLRHVANLCRRYEVLLIVDEVATGFGRTGTMFAVEQENVHPDFLCVAKSLTGGYLPLAATLTMERIYQAFLGRFDEFKAFFHGHTYTANPLACAVAIANLEQFKKRSLLRNVCQRTLELEKGLESLKMHRHIKEIRQVGLMAGVEIVRDKETGIPYEPGERMGLKICDACLKRGVWLRPLGDTLVLMPPLAIQSSELQFLIQVLRQAIQDTVL